jgi:hypothetical protein
MSTDFTFVVDQAAVDTFTQVVVDEWVRDNRDELVETISARAPRGETGALRSSHVGRYRRSERVFEVAATAEHALPVHQGHGPIRPIAPGGYVVTPGVKGRRPAPPKGFLKFQVGGRTVFAREVAAQPARPWMVDGLRSLGFDDVTHITPGR